MKTLTLTQLQKVRACDREAALFAELFGEDKEVTRENTLAVAHKFDWLFAAKYLLTPRQNRYFRSLMHTAFRELRRVPDPDQSRRRKALANAFYLAYNGPED